jgi:hypothetical protein
MMNPGVGEEAGQTARSFIDALKGQPAVLALIVANAAMLVFMFYALSKAAQFRDNLLTQQFNYQREVSQLLAKCVIPDKGELKWPGTEEKSHSSVTPSPSSQSTFVASITQAGDLAGWYCTIPLHQPFINGGTRSRPNKE